MHAPTRWFGGEPTITGLPCNAGIALLDRRARRFNIQMEDHPMHGYR